MNARIKWAILACVSVGLLGFVASKVDVSTVVDVLLGADLKYLIILVCFSLAAFSLLPTYRWQKTLAAMGYHLPFLILLYARYGCQPLKMAIPMKGGEAFRAVYIRRRHGVPLTHGGGSILFDMFLVAVSQLTYLCLGLALAGGEVTGALLPTMAILVTGLVLASKRVQRLLVRQSAHISERVHKVVSEVAHGFLEFDLTTKIKLVCISYVVEFAEFCGMYLCCLALGLSIPIWSILAYIPIVIAITLIPVTVSGLGTREVAIFYLFANFATPEQLAGLALLLTFVEFILPSLIGCFFLPSFLSAISGEAVEECLAPPTEARSSEHQ